jgi:hypothetical protein
MALGLVYASEGAWTAVPAALFALWAIQEALAVQECLRLTLERCYQGAQSGAWAVRGYLPLARLACQMVLAPTLEQVVGAEQLQVGALLVAYLQAAVALLGEQWNVVTRHAATPGVHPLLWGALLKGLACCPGAGLGAAPRRHVGWAVSGGPTAQVAAGEGRQPLTPAPAPPVPASQGWS